MDDNEIDDLELCRIAALYDSDDDAILCRVPARYDDESPAVQQSKHTAITTL